MTETHRINILCPLCGEQLEKKYEESKGKWVTYWSIYCVQKQCNVDTGRQATIPDAYEALLYMYYGAKSVRKYEKGGKT